MEEDINYLTLTLRYEMYKHIDAKIKAILEKNEDK